jgi:cytochrome c-type biogenesis protein CcmH
VSRTVRRAVAIVTLVLAAGSAAGAQGAVTADPVRADSVRADSVLEARTAAVAAQLRCAVCQGISIEDSPSSLAREMREVVKEQLRAGRTPEEVTEYFVSKYGEWILLSPKARGLNLMIYVLPALLLLSGLALIAVTVRRWTSGAVDVGEQVADSDERAAGP